MSSGEGENEVDFCLKLCSKDELASVWPGKCVYVVEEIIHTEQVYVTDLENIVKGYREPFSHHSCVKNSGIDDLTDTIFGNVSDLLYLHRSLLKDMTTYSKQPADYGDVFLQHKNEFNHYKVYCKNFPKAIQLVQDCMDNHMEIATVFKQCQHKMNHALPLPSLLIKPVQRILKYHLLLANITKQLTPNFQGFTNLCKAHNVMLKVAADINETQRLYEASIRMQEIENCLIGWKGQKLNTYGNVLLEDYLKVIGFKGLRYVVVFEKLLLLLKKDRKDNVKYHYKGHIEGDEVSLMATPIRNHPFCFKVFSIVNRDHYYLLETKNEDEKMKWMATLVSLIETDLSMTPNDILTRTSALPPTVALPDQDAIGSRKRHRSSQEDEGVPELKQREALSDQSNFAEDIGPAPAVVKRHYAVRRKTSVQSQAEINDDDQQSGIVDKPYISDVIPQEAATDAKLLEYTTLDDENAQVTPLAELSGHDHTQWSDNTREDEQSLLRAQSVSLGVEHYKQEQENKESNEDVLLKQHESFNSLDLDAENKFESTMQRWDDVTNLAKLKDDVSGNTGMETTSTTVPYRESIVSVSSLESFTIDEHGNLDRQFSDYDKMKSASSSNRSSCVDIDDIVINTDPSMFTIPEEADGPPGDEVDGVHEETKEADNSNDSASQGYVIQSIGDDEVDFHDENPAVPSLSFDTVHSKGSSPVKSQSSDTDSEEEHDIDPSAHDSPMYTTNASSHGNRDDRDASHVAKEDNDMFVTASGRFIAPTSTLPRMRRSMTMVGNSPYSLDSTPDSPGVSALARKRFHLVAKSFELYKDDEIQEGYSVDDGAVMLSQDILTTSSLPPPTVKRSQSVRAARSQSVVKKSPRRPLKRSSLIESHSGPNSLSSPPLSFKTEEQHSSFAVKNLAPVFEGIRSKKAVSDSNTEPASAVNVAKRSSDTTQFTCSIDTTDNSNAPLSPPKPFQFTASAEVHSLPTGTRETSTTITPIQGLTTNTSPKDDNDEFSTPENQIGVPLIQPLSQSPHVAGKTPHDTSAMVKSKLFTSATASDSPLHYASATKESSTLSESTDSNTFTTPDVAIKSTDLTTGQQNVEYSMEHNLLQTTSDGKDDVKDINDAAYVQLDAANLTKEQNDSEVPSSAVLPSLLTPAATEEMTSTALNALSDDSNSSSFDSLSPLVLSLSKSSVLQQVVDSDKSAQFPVTPDPLPSYKATTKQIPQTTSSVSPSKSPKDFTHLQAPTEKKHSRRKHPNDPYALSPQASRLVRSLEYTDSTQSNEGQAHKSPIAISPSLKYSRSLGDVATPKLKSMSTPSTPTTDVSFELPPENVVLQGRVSSFSMNDSNDNPLLSEMESHITIDDVNEAVDEEDDREYGETSPLIGRGHPSQPKTRNRQKPQHKVTSYSSIEEAQPLLAEDSDEDNATASSSWFNNFSVRSAIGYLINLGSGIGNLLYYYISQMFRPRPDPNNNHIN